MKSPVTWGCLALALAAPLAAAEPAAPAEVNDVARLLAGLTPAAGGFEAEVATPAWQNHRAFFEKNWAAVTARRIEPVQAWRVAAVTPDPAITTLFYPFSGPDFLNAYLFFPNAETYVFYSLESPGVLPDLHRLSPEEFETLLGDIRVSLGDLFDKQYFITQKMLTHLRTPELRGNAVLIGLFMARLGLEISSVESVRVSSAGVLEPDAPGRLGALAKRAAERPVPGVRISFHRPGGPAQTLLYFSVDVSNESLGAHPEFLAYLRDRGTGATFLKSASYLLHNPHFTRIRDAILAGTRYLCQDDSGLPYRFFKTWTTTLYGRYTKPVKDFSNEIQTDLNEAYAAKPPRPLPFTFGYHWGDRHSNLQIAVRPAASDGR